MLRRSFVSILILVIPMILTQSTRAQQKPVAPGFSPAKPFTQDQAQGLVRDGLGDESGAKLIEQRGIDFAPAEDFLQSLKTAGANEAFLKALRAAKPFEPASAKKPLNQVQVFALLAGQVASHRVAMLVKERGIEREKSPRSRLLTVATCSGQRLDFALIRPHTSQEARCNHPRRRTYKPQSMNSATSALEAQGG